MDQRTGIQGFKLIAFVLVAFAQLIASGFAFTPNSNGISFIICTADGAQSISWEEYFGDEFPSQPSRKENEHNSCHACVMSCRAGVFTPAEQGGHSHPTFRYVVTKHPEVIAVLIPSRTSPPMPSRSPPVHVL